MSGIHPKLKGLLWLILVAALAALAAGGIPFVARHVPWSFEERLAHLDGVSREIRTCFAPAGQAALKKLVGRLYPHAPAEKGGDDFPLTVEVIDGSTVNAFASLGGHVYVYDGLLRDAESPEELAGVLAHEIEHVKRRHIIQGAFSRLISGGHVATFLLEMRFSRDQEAEADRGGLARLRDARIDASGFQRFFERMEKNLSVPAILSDHPSDADRSALAEQSRGYPTEPILTPAEWASLRKICHQP